MQKPSHRLVTAVAGALGALVLALPLQSAADWSDWSEYGDHSRGGSAYPYAQRYYGYDDNYSHRPYSQQPYSGGEGQRGRDWQRLQHERREMEEARREGDWDRYRHEKREAQEAARALRHHHHDDD